MRNPRRSSKTEKCPTATEIQPQITYMTRSKRNQSSITSSKISYQNIVKKKKTLKHFTNGYKTKPNTKNKSSILSKKLPNDSEFPINHAITDASSDDNHTPAENEQSVPNIDIPGEPYKTVVMSRSNRIAPVENDQNVNKNYITEKPTKVSVLAWSNKIASAMAIENDLSAKKNDITDKPSEVPVLTQSNQIAMAVENDLSVKKMDVTKKTFKASVKTRSGQISSAMAVENDQSVPNAEKASVKTRSNKIVPTEEYSRRTRSKTSPKTSHVCEICQKEFNSQIKLEKHATRHDPKKPYGCDICGKFFDDPKYVKRHRTLHEKKLKKECDVCGKVFNERIFFDIHRLTHVERKPFRCDICEDIFTDQMTFLKHRSHHKVTVKKVGERFLTMKEVLKQKLEDRK